MLAVGPIIQGTINCHPEAGCCTKFFVIEKIKMVFPTNKGGFLNQKMRLKDMTELPVKQ